MAPEKTDPDSCDEGANTSTVSVDSTTEREPYFEPVVNLPEVHVKTNEEEEIELLKLRCKLFRYHTQETPSEWKERGTGDVKILHNSEKDTIRLLMRQDKTLKIRANHYITPIMELKPNCNSDRAWVWCTYSDFADEEPKHETFAIRFANAENAKLFKEKFDEARGIATVSLVKMQEKLLEEDTNLKIIKEEAVEKSQETLEEKKDNITADLVAQELEKKLIVKDSDKE